MARLCNRDESSLIRTPMADYRERPYREGDYPPELKADLADERCMICETQFRAHSQRQFERCMAEIIKKTREPLRRNETANLKIEKREPPRSHWLG